MFPPRILYIWALHHLAQAGISLERPRYPLAWAIRTAPDRETPNPDYQLISGEMYIYGHMLNLHRILSPHNCSTKAYMCILISLCLGLDLPLELQRVRDRSAFMIEHEAYCRARWTIVMLIGVLGR